MAGSYQTSVFHRLLGTALDWVFPPKCAGCGKPGTSWCDACQLRAQIIRGKVCPICGSPQEREAPCAACRQEPPAYESLRSWALYENPVKQALLGLKFKHNLPVAQSLAVQAAPILQELKWPVDIVAPIPISMRRLRERGYNQAGLIAHPIATALGLSYAPKALARWRDTHSQVGLTGDQRRENVRGVFRADGARVRGRTILLIDDIATTGSTLSSAAEALLAGGASKVYAFTIARALHWRHDLPAGAISAYHS